MSMAKKKPSSGVLLSMADFFDKPAGYFFREPAVRLASLSAREAVLLPKKKWQALQAAIVEHLEPYLLLEELLGLHVRFVNPLAGIDIRSQEDAEKAAQQLRKAWELGQNPISNAFEMLENRQVKVLELQGLGFLDGLGILAGGGMPVLVIAKHQNLVQKRFTAFAELGHILLSIQHQDRDSICERFAAALLLPGEALKVELGPKRSHISHSELIHIKDYYGISTSAIMARAKDLGIISGRLAKSYDTRQLQEPSLVMDKGYGYYAGEEATTRFDQLLARALAEELISYSKAAELTGKPVDEVRKTFALL